MAKMTGDRQDVPMPRRLLIVDDDPRFRQLMKLLLADAPEFEVVGEAHKGSSALTVAREVGPDVILLDVNLPDTTGFELAPQLSAEAESASIVMTSSRGDDTYEQLAQEAGASGFVPKEELSAAALARALD
jgi:DNA-binding NarL/FixJ family response regulator